jgi:branched-subunit amino acid ABC-type transport system permease component
MRFEQVFQYFLAGLTEGAIYSIVAIGFNIIYNTTGIINFAQGEFLVLGAMIAVSLSAFLPLALPWPWRWRPPSSWVLWSTCCSSAGCPVLRC